MRERSECVSALAADDKLANPAADGAKSAVPPSVDAMLKWPSVAALEAQFGRVPLVEALRLVATAIRDGSLAAHEAAVAAGAKA